jgi:hypothetical protein
VLDDEVLGPVASNIRGPYEDVLFALSKAGARLEPGWPPGVDLPANMKTFQYLLFAFVTVEATEEEREQARQRLKRDANDVTAAAAVQPHALAARDATPRRSALWQILREP